MMKSILTISVVLLAGALMTGCDMNFKSYGSPEILTRNQQPPVTDNANYLEDLVDDQHTSKDDNTAVDIAARLSEKYGQAVERLNELQVKHQTLSNKDRNSQVQIAKLTADVARAEKELTEANAMLLEMREDLAKWKKDVLSFRSEMRQSQKAVIEGVTKLHVLISGGVAMDPPVKSAPIAVTSGR